jgi:CheY-like chemotaxis protein
MMDDRLCVVVVDDDPEFRTFMQVLLESEGYRTVLASSVAELQGVLAAERPHLIICDVRLPNTRPFAVLDILRETPKTADIPVLVCTGAVMEVEERQPHLVQSGVTVLIKPFDIDVLLRRVADLLSTTHHQDSDSQAR